MKIPPMLLHAFTTADNTALDPIRCMMVISGFAVIGMNLYAIAFNHQPFNPMETGSGLALIFTGGGVGLAAKARDEGPTNEV